MARKMSLPSDTKLGERLASVNRTLYVVQKLHPLIIDELRKGEGVLTAPIIVSHLITALEVYSNELSVPLTSYEKQLWLELYVKVVITDHDILTAALRIVL